MSDDADTVTGPTGEGPDRPRRTVPPRGDEPSGAAQRRARPQPGAGVCDRCAQTVPAGAGVWEGKRVRHDGDCPPYPDGYTGPTWGVGYGVEAAYSPKPAGGYQVGQVARETLSEHAHPVPTSAPGWSRVGDQLVSVIVTVLAEYPPRYYRDEDDNQPPDLVGVDGWSFEALVRPATDQEAAPVLATEAVRARRDELERRRTSLLAWRYPTLPDATRPAQPQLDAAVRVPFPADDDRSWASVDDELRVDEAAGVVWTLAYNGADGDDWSRNNYRHFVALAHPFTDQRRELVAALRAEYTVADLVDRARVGQQAAEALAAAGWTLEQTAAQLGGFRLVTEADVNAVLDQWGLWESTGWLVPTAEKRFTVTDARRLARAGVGHLRAAQLARAGLDVTQMESAAPPPIPPEAARIIITPADRFGSAEVSGDPAIAADWLAARPSRWADQLQVAVDIRCVHTKGEWSLWDDGSLVVRARWLDEQERASVPQQLHPAAVTAISLVAGGGAGSTVRNRSVWHPLRQATGHTATTVEEKSRDDGGSWAGKKLVRHEFTVAEQPVVWWELATYAGGWGGGDADHVDNSQVWADEPPARAAYRDHRL